MQIYVSMGTFITFFPPLANIRHEFSYCYFKKSYYIVIYSEKKIPIIWMESSIPFFPR